MTKICFGMAVAALGLLAVACSGGSSNEMTPTPTVNKTVAAISTEKAFIPPTSPPTSTPLLAGQDVRLCHGSDVATLVHGNAATGGQLLAYITLGLGSGTPCRLSGAPDVQFLDASGDVLPIRLDGAPPCVENVASSSCMLEPSLLIATKIDDRNATTGVRSGQAMLTLTWHIHDGSGLCPTPKPQATQVRLLLRGVEDEVVVPVGIAPCDWRVTYWGYVPGTAP